VLKGNPLLVVIDKDLKVEEVGRPIHGRTVETVYAFDKLVVPVGTDI